MKLWFVFIIFTILTISCEKVTNEPEFIAIEDHQQKFSNNELVLVYEGDRYEDKLFPKRIYLENSEGNQFFFNPHDFASITQSSFIVDPAWAPDGSWLVVPNGRFEGFMAFPTSILPEGIARSSDGERIGIESTQGIRLWHEFVDWTSPTTIRFKAGLSYDFMLFEYDFMTR